MKKAGVALLLLGLALPARPAEIVSFRGYLKNFFTAIFPPSYQENRSVLREPAYGLVDERLRLKLDLRLTSRIAFDGAYEISARVQDPRLFEESIYFSGQNPPDYRFADLRKQIYPGPGQSTASFGLFENLDRFVVSVKTSAADILVGRQPVAWGSGRVINPTDVLAPFAFDEPDKEDRRGVDALRVRVPLGPLDELDVGAVAGRDFEPSKSAFYLRAKTTQLKTDVSGLAMSFRTHLLLGLDIARSIGGAGFWLEAAQVVPRFFQKEEEEETRSYFRASLGFDYNFSAKSYAFFEYHFNGAGETRSRNYLGQLSSPAYQDGFVYLLGRQYVSVGSTYQVTPLLPFTGLVIINLNDGSFVLAPHLEYNIAENIYLAAAGYLGFGKRPESAPGLAGLQPSLLHSEFGAYPGVVFASFRVYF